MKAWWQASQNQWYCSYKGKKTYLCYGPNTKEMKLVAEKIMRKKCSQFKSRLGEYNKVRDYASFFLEHVKGDYKPKSYEMFCTYVNGFAEKYGHIKVVEILPVHLTEFIAGKNWAAASINICAKILKRMFSWGIEQGLLENNPLKSFQLRPETCRSHLVLITNEEHDKLLRATGAEGKRTLNALHDTGCRPSELMAVRAEHYDSGLRAWVFRDEETKTPQRVVYLNDAMVVMTEALIDRGREHLFRNPKTKKPWRAVWVLDKWFTWLKKKAGIERAEVIPYSYRHKFATDLLLSGVSTMHVAKLLGHKNTKQVEKHYGHLVHNADLGKTLEKRQ